MTLEGVVAYERGVILLARERCCLIVIEVSVLTRRRPSVRVRILSDSWCCTRHHHYSLDSFSIKTSVWVGEEITSSLHRKPFRNFISCLPCYNRLPNLPVSDLFYLGSSRLTLKTTAEARAFNTVKLLKS